MQEVIKQQAQEVNETVELVKGDFTSAEAYHVISALIREKVNFHKLHRWKLYERNHQADTYYSDTRINELEAQLTRAKQFLDAAEALGSEVNVESVLKITLK